MATNSNVVMGGHEHGEWRTFTSLEVSILVVVLTSVWLVFRSTFLTIFKDQKLKRAGQAPLPPGPLWPPLIGQTIPFVRYFFNNNLGEFLWLQTARYGPTFRLSLFGTPTAILGSPVGNKFILLQEGKLVEASWPLAVRRLIGKYGSSMMTGVDHRVARAHLAKFFNAGATARVMPLVEKAAVSNLETRWDSHCGGAPVSASELAASFTFSVIMRLVMSLQGGRDLERLVVLFDVWGRGMFSLIMNFPAGFTLHPAYKARIKIKNFLQEHIDRRRRYLKEGKQVREDQDLLWFLLTTADEAGNLHSDDYILDGLIEIIAGGFKTTSSTLIMAMWYMSVYPETRVLMEQEHEAIAKKKKDGEGLTPDDLAAMKYTWQVFQETLRLNSPAFGGLRLAIKEFEYNGYTIPKGWKVMWSNNLAHEDEEVYKDPKKFDPSRFEPGVNANMGSYNWLAFGSGNRVCPGYQFAKQQLLVFMHHLILRYSWEVANPKLPIIRVPTSASTDGNLIKLTRKILK